VAFIEKHQTEPFFLYLPFNAVHIPMEATDTYLERFGDIQDERRGTYVAMQSAMDDAIGVVLQKLRDCGLEENTLVLFLSDHGGAAGSRTPNGALNAPLRGAKLDLYEGGHPRSLVAPVEGQTFGCNDLSPASPPSRPVPDDPRCCGRGREDRLEARWGEPTASPDRLDQRLHSTTCSTGKWATTSA
jgi:hypothetical protein